MSGPLVLRWLGPPGSPPPISVIIGPRGLPGVLYEQTFGDGSATVFTITHNLHTRKFVANIYATAGDQPDQIADIYRVSDDQIRLEFLDPPGMNALCIVLVGVAIPS